MVTVAVPLPAAYGLPAGTVTRSVTVSSPSKWLLSGLGTTHTTAVRAFAANVTVPVCDARSLSGNAS